MFISRITMEVIQFRDYIAREKTCKEVCFKAYIVETKQHFFKCL